MTHSNINPDPEPSSQNSNNSRSYFKGLLLNFLIELIIYGGLVTIYYLLVLRYLSQPLELLYDRYLPLYAFTALILIVAQGVVLENITTFLLYRLGLGRRE